MANFEKYIPILYRWEAGIPKSLESLPFDALFESNRRGAWVDHPNDNGGATMAGVTLSLFRTFYGTDKGKEDLKNITIQQWTRVMRTFWDRCQADKIENQSIANILVDWHINAGLHGVKNAQKALGLQPDGIIGPKSLAVLNSPNGSVIFHRIKEAREAYYRKLAQIDSTQRVFLGGWLNRVRSFNFE